jgi:DNA modification methylase
VSHSVRPSLFPDLETASLPLSRKERLTFKANLERGRHGWLRLTPAYSVHLVEELVSHCTSADLVLDPFCGTGTTALACGQMGIPCHTVDINPFLAWLTRAKCAVYTQAERENARSLLEQALAALDTRNAVTWIPPIKDIHKWWEPETLALLAQIFEMIERAPLTPPARDLLRVIFCRAQIELAAVSFGHQSMSFKKKEAAPALFEFPVEERLRATFRQVDAEILEGASSSPAADTAQVFLGDSRDLTSILPDRRYTTIITSPPYPNRMSYIRELRPYMYWLGYLTTGREAGDLDWQAIGGTWGLATSNLLKWTPDPRYRVPDEGFQSVVERIAQQSKVLSLYVSKYFQDVVQHIQSLRRVLAPGATVQYIIGNSKFYDILLPTEQIYAAIFRDQGFQNINVVPIRKRSSKKELFEHLITAHA